MPGVTITAKYDEVVDYILIEQGAKIDAQGTASQPIVMTSEKKNRAHGAACISAVTPIRTTEREVLKSATPHTAATTTLTIPVR